MPALSAAAMIIEFFGTCIGLPSISMLTMSGAAPGALGCALMPSPRQARGRGERLNHGEHGEKKNEHRQSNSFCSSPCSPCSPWLRLLILRKSCGDLHRSVDD